MATTAALTTFRRVYADPGATGNSRADDERRAAYSLLWAYHNNSVFENVIAWQAYRSTYQLYRGTRAIYNPARRLVDFYVGTVYQGQWTQRPDRMTEPGTAIPFDEETPPAYLAAIAQLWQWSNWQSQKALAIRYAAAVGDALAVVVDDPERGKVYLDTIWPGHVTAVDVDARGNVAAYALEYDVLDPDTAKPYTYRREVDGVRIVEYRDDRMISETANPYGFVPAAWIQHTPTASTHGEPAMRNVSKVDEVCSFAAHALDQAHRILSAPILVAGDQVKIGPPSATVSTAGPTTTNTQRGEAQQKIDVITGGDGAHLETLQMDTGDAIAHIEHMIAEIERDHPEITLYSQLRGMSQVTGPGAARLFGDVEAYVDAARAQYDQATIKLCQMATAIGGWRLATNAWGPTPSRQQATFAGFDLESYYAGDLDLSIQSRPLIPLTEEERISIERQRIGLDADRTYTMANAAAGQSGTPAGIASRIQAAAEGAAA